MGLLDEAIREHLELKRRSGADPGEIAREEHEALDPHPDEDPGQAPAVESGDFSPVGQETAELDMQSVLDQGEPTGAHAEGQARSAGQSAEELREGPREEDAFEWELPAEHAHEGPPAEIPGQERLTFE